MIQYTICQTILGQNNICNILLNICFCLLQLAHKYSKEQLLKLFHYHDFMIDLNLKIKTMLKYSGR